MLGHVRQNSKAPFCTAGQPPVLLDLDTNQPAGQSRPYATGAPTAPESRAWEERARAHAANAGGVPPPAPRRTARQKASAPQLDYGSYPLMAPLTPPWGPAGAEACQTLPDPARQQPPRPAATTTASHANATHFMSAPADGQWTTNSAGPHQDPPRQPPAGQPLWPSAPQPPAGQPTWPRSQFNDRVTRSGSGPPGSQFHDRVHRSGSGPPANPVPHQTCRFIKKTEKIQST